MIKKIKFYLIQGVTNISCFAVITNNMKKLFAIVFIFISVQTLAQENSPYTRFALGALNNSNPAFLKGWGDMSAAFQDQSTFNISNPASLAELRLTVLQGGIYGNGMKIKSADSAAHFGYAAPEYITLAFPLWFKHCGVSLGLLPYSRSNYNVYQLNAANGSLPKSVNSFIGSGSLYQAYLAMGWKIKNLSFGLTGAYLFGNLNNDSRLIFGDSLNGFNTLYRLNRTVNGIIWNAGIQYDLKMKDEKHLLFGISGHTDMNVNSKRDFLFERYVFSSLGNEIPTDTIASSFGEKGKVILPAVFNVGVIFKNKEKLKIGINYSYNNFSSYRSFNSIDSTANAYKLSLGIEYVPNPEALEGYYKRMKYRAGLYYGNYFLSLRNEQLKQKGFTLGFGLPLKKYFSLLDFSFDFGSTGTVKNNLLQESYVRGTLGFTLADKWFIPRKYD